ncbi:hypothetical protein Tco_0981208 [Tanacetum coccineum]
MPRVESVMPSGVIIEDWVNDLQATNKPSLKRIEFTNARNESVKPKQVEKPRIITQNPKKVAKKSVLKNIGKNTGEREFRPVWNSTQRINHQNKFVPSVVLTRFGRVPVSATKQSSLRATTSTSTFTPVNTATHRNRVNISKLRTNAFHKSHSPIRKPFYKSTTPNTRISNEKVNNVRVNSVNTVGQTAVSAIKGTGSLLLRPHQTRSKRVLEKPNKPPLSKGHTSGSGEGSMEYHFELTDNVPPTPHDSPLSGGNTLESDEGRMELIKELMETYTSFTKRVLTLEEAKTAQDRMINRLKLRVKRLEKKRKERTPQPMRRRLFKGRVETSTDTSLGEDTSKQGRSSNKTKPMFKDSDFDVLDAEQITTTGPSHVTTVFDDEDVTMAMAQTLIKIKEVKANEKGVEFRNMEEASRPFDEIQARIDADALFAAKLQQEERAVYH